MQQLDNDDEGKDDDGDKNDSEEAIKTKEKCKAEAIASAEANTDTGYYHHGIGYSVIADISTWEKEIRKNAAVSLGSCSVKDSIKENIIGTSSMVIIGRLHNIIASIGYRTHEKDHQPGKGLCIFSEYSELSLACANHG